MKTSSERRRYRMLSTVFFLPFLLTLPVSAAEVSLQVPGDYKTSLITTLGKVTAFTFDFQGNYIVAEDIGAPVSKRRPAIVAFRVNKVSPDGTSIALLERTTQNITNLSYHQGVVYIVARGRIYKIAKGKIADIISSLPTYGDYGNSNVVFSSGFMYFALGTATNSGIVGPDNSWLNTYPSVRDVPCASIQLSGVNTDTDNYLTAKKDDKAVTGSFSTFNTPVSPGQIVYGMNKCNGGVIKARPDGSLIQVYAWGLHNPKGLSVDDSGRLWVFDGGMEDRGVRPVKNGADAFYQIAEDTWYGWPDFSAGTPVDHKAILSEFPNTPPKPQAVFDLDKIKNLVISPESFFFNSALAQSSDETLGRLDLSGNNMTDFLSVTEGKIIQHKFGPDDRLYVLVSTDAGKTELHVIEPTMPLTGSIIEPSAPKASYTNWMVGVMIAVIAAAGFFAFKNLRRPIPPLG